MKVISINSFSAFKLLNNNKNYHIIDVRTQREWQKGVPKIDNLSLISWRLYPDMSVNEAFNRQILELKKTLDSQSALFFICKSGMRSYEAANIAIECNIDNCYNIIDGFEGNSFGAGWKENNLPYHIPQEVM